MRRAPPVPDNRKIGQAIGDHSLHVDRMTNAQTTPEKMLSDLAGSSIEAPDPTDAVAAWWTAMQSADLATLGNLLADDYVVSGGPDGRTIGRRAVLEQAAAFTAEATIDDWVISAMELRVGEDHAICSYGWEERGTHAGSPFRFHGLATDVLRLTSGVWVHQARHVSMLASPAAPPVRDHDEMAGQAPSSDS